MRAQLSESSTTPDRERATVHEPRPHGLHTPRLAALAPFAIRNFRVQWPADLLTQWAMEMEVLILGWYVLTETDSVLLLTLYGALLYVGTLIAPMFGVVGDRIGHRNVLGAMRAVYTVLATTLMALAFAGLLNPFAVFVIAALTGVVRPSDIGVRSALVADIMPPQHLIAAMSISRTTIDSARVAGALSGAGVFAALGMGPAYLVVATFYVLGTILTLCVRVKPPAHRAIAAEAAAARPSPWRDLKEGMLYIWRSPRLLAAMWLAFLANMTAYPFTVGLLPHVAKDIYHIGQTGLGYLLASFSGGALIGSVTFSLIGSRLGVPMPRVMLVSAVGWYALLLMFGQATTATAGMTYLALAGFLQSLCMVALAVVLMGDASEKFRGRVMGVRMLAVYGMPLGLLLSGPLVEHAGFALTGSFFSIFGIVATLLIALGWRVHLWHPAAAANLR
jgi:predicted MFS family arabinose efflux permease